MTQSDPTTPSQIGPGSDGFDGVLRIPQSSSITRASPSDCLVLYPGYWLAVYSTTPVDWAEYPREKCELSTAFIYVNKRILLICW